MATEEPARQAQGGATNRTVCAVCGGADSLKRGQYRGPWGHFIKDPRTKAIREGWDCCFDCWVNAWALSPDRSVSRGDYLLALITAKVGQPEIARRLRVPLRTLQRRFARLRKESAKKRN